MKTKVLKNQLVYTINYKTNKRSTYRRDVTVWEWEADPKKKDAECLLHNGIADLIDTSEGWKVIRINY